MVLALITGLFLQFVPPIQDPSMYETELIVAILAQAYGPDFRLAPIYAPASIKYCVWIQKYQPPTTSTPFGIQPNPRVGEEIPPGAYFTCQPRLNDVITALLKTPLPAWVPPQ